MPSTTNSDSNSEARLCIRLHQVALICWMITASPPFSCVGATAPNVESVVDSQMDFDYVYLVPAGLPLCSHQRVGF